MNDNGTVLTAADCIAKWDGSNWSALGGIALSGSTVYVGGEFYNVKDNGTVFTAADYIAAYRTTTGTYLPVVVR